MRDGDDDALPNAATGCEAQAMEEHAAEDIKHIPPTTVRLPAARSLPLGLADGGHAALRRGEPSCRKSGARSRSGRGGSAGGQRARRLRRRTPHWRCAQQPAHCRVAARAGGWSVRVLVVRVACRLKLGEKFMLVSSDRGPYIITDPQTRSSWKKGSEGPWCSAALLPCAGGARLKV